MRMTMPSIQQAWSMTKALGSDPFDARYTDRMVAVRLCARVLNPDAAEYDIRRASEWYVDTLGEYLMFASWVDEPSDITTPILYTGQRTGSL